MKIVFYRHFSTKIAVCSSMKTPDQMIRRFHGAANQIRTGDLILTKDALYRLSYSSERKNGTIMVPFFGDPDGT